MAGAVVTSWLPVCWTHPGTPCSQMGSSEPHEVLDSPLGWTWSFGLLTRGTGTLERQFWMQVFGGSRWYPIWLRGNVEIARGYPRMISTVGPSSTRKEILSWWRQHTCRVIGGDRNLMCPRPSTFPCMVSIFSSARLWWGKSSCFRRAREMKLPEDPESTRAGTEMKWHGVSSCTVSSGRVEIAGYNWRVLTAGRGGREGHTRMKCPGTPQ